MTHVLPDIASEYSAAVDASRQRITRDLTLAARIDLAKLYVSELDAVFARLGRGAITPEQARELAGAIERALRRYNIRSEPAVKRYIIRALEDVRRAHIEATGVIPGRVQASFSGLAQEAFEEMFKRRQLGVVNTFKTLTRHSAQASASAVAKTLQQALVTLSPDEAVAKIALEMASGDSFMADAVRQYGQPTGIRRFMRGAGRIDLADPAFKAARKISYDAWRIVRTELAAAAHEGDRIGSAQSPVVSGLKWNLSPRHPKPDICDLYAKLDLHGMGEGVFPAELIPVKPHPHDLCFNTHVFRPVSEWDQPKASPRKPQVPKMGDVVSILQGQTPNAIVRAFRQVRADTRRALESWEALEPRLRGSG